LPKKSYFGDWFWRHIESRFTMGKLKRKLP